ncbi:hypothetical protein EC847_10264 [Scandinavium goeteborgense]|uniref:Uncharacterized protein n=1 Tax=Scandinavium goeteborgense TaxID=1851514 RepID=A0A4R6EQ82_SCAGO|nr:hypothetical protein EC847_10264 [Scandinavium goeteborgense]
MDKFGGITGILEQALREFMYQSASENFCGSRVWSYPN